MHYAKKRWIYQQCKVLLLIRIYLVKNTTKMGDRKQGLDKIFFKKQSISERVAVKIALHVSLQKKSFDK